MRVMFEYMLQAPAPVQYNSVFYKYDTDICKITPFSCNTTILWGD